MTPETDDWREGLGNHGPKARDCAYAARVAYVERLARAAKTDLFAQSGEDGRGYVGDEADDLTFTFNGRLDPARLVRAVLTAMREPPIPMSTVGAEEWRMAIEELLKP